MAIPSDKEGMEALHLLKSTEPPEYLVPSEKLSKAAKTASQHLFARVQPHVPKSPFEKLLVEGFDAEQIWQQLELQSQPLISSLRRQVKQWEKNPEDIIGIFRKNVEVGLENDSGRKELYDVDDVDMDEFDDDDDDEDDVDDDVEEEEEEEEKEEESGHREKKGGQGGLEDKFLKIKDLQEFLQEGEAREFGLDTKKKRSDERSSEDEEEEDEGEEEGQDEDDDELGIYDEAAGEEDDFGNAKYEDFFGDKKKKAAKGRSKLADESEEESESGDEEDVGNNEKSVELSTHEKQLQKLQVEIEEMEKENLEAKHWTMQGEVTAANRPKNSALEEILDYEQKVRPPPEMTEEFHESLEDMIKERIVKGQFDDIERIASVPSKSSRELKELDDNKSKKGLAEVYEEEYVQTTNPAAGPSSFTDEQKKEASMLFKKICLKLDALSHFHFAPKPVIEDMSVQANVPALAMEEIAPTAVSDAAMLAPEEVFSGKGDIKDEAELTQAERKRRRANKKRKFKAKKMEKTQKKARDSSLQNSDDGEKE